MSDNTLQFLWIVMIQGNLAALFRDDPHVFIAGDLLWYPVEGNNKLRIAPDTMVAFGRPKGHRGSYMQWREGGIAPQVVFEVLSPGNRQGELVRKFKFYERYGVEEYYMLDPDHQELSGWIRRGDELADIAEIAGWTSPRLKIRFEFDDQEWRFVLPNGRPFLSFEDIAEQRDKLAEQRDELTGQRDRLAAKLRELGIDPES